MNDEFPRQPFIYEGAEPVGGSDGGGPDDESPGVTEKISRAVHSVGDAYASARRPGMPLSILANIAREAPLGSLLVAFMLGMFVARRRD